MKKVLALLIFLCIHGLAPAQYWMQTCGGPTVDEGMDVDGDAHQHFYATGYFTSSAAFDAMNVNSAGVEDIYIVKGDTSGVIQWVKTAGGPATDKPLSIDVDSAGGFVITGYFYATALFESQAVVSLGQQDVFVARYDSSGSLLWVQSGGGAGSDAGNSVTFDGAGNVLVTGEFSGSCTFGAFTLVSLGGSIDVFTVKYSSSGTVLWARQGAGKSTDRGTDITADAAGNIYVSGLFSDTITFDLPHYNTINNAMFLVRYSPSGTEQWFRWMGSGGTVGMAGTEWINGGIHLAGAFSGTLFFFDGISSVPLSSAHPNNVFVCRYDTTGTLVWSHADGSSSMVSAVALAAGPNGTTLLSGLFQCCFTDYSAHYGGGLLCSMGLTDTYVAGYDNAGNWLWARHYGSRSDDVVNGLGVYGDSLPVTTGSYRNTLFSTAAPDRFRGYHVNGFLSNGAYCGDADYGQYVTLAPVGSSDGYINGNLDLAREPLDFFMRSGSSCDRSFPEMCVDNNSTMVQPCPDTLHGCGALNLFAKSLTWTAFGYAPVFTYQWNNGSVTSGTFVLADGTYGVAMTDGACYSATDSVYVMMHSNPAQPRITDSKGINVDTFITEPVRLCLPDSVQLYCTNAGAFPVHWSGYPVGQNPVTVSTSGTYSVQFTDSFGCTSGSAFVTVFASNSLPPVIPYMACLEDQADGNDSIDLCYGDFFTLFLYDSLSNPSGSIDCFPEMDTAYWLAVPDTFLSFVSPTQCTPNAVNFFVASEEGEFDVIFSAYAVRQNDCDSDSVFFTLPMHISVHPLPPSGGLAISITGPTQMCFGDTVMLVSTGGPNHQWSDGSTGDTLYVTQAGFYGAGISDTVINAFGCKGISTGSAGHFITYFPEPTLASTPGDGLICLNDSVALVCTGSGTFHWQGPAGTPNVDNDTIYVTIPGVYSCVVTVAPGCDLVTNTVQVTQYSTPFIAFSPGTNLCLTDSVQLTAVGNTGSTFLWDPPFSDTLAMHTVQDAGTYVCHITSCGIVTQASITLVEDTASAVITASATSFCQGDSVLLTAGAAASFVWQPSGDTLQSIYVNQGGPVTLIVQSLLGCSDSSQVMLTEVSNTLTPPVVTDTQVCAGSSALLIAVGADTITWCTSPSYSSAFHSGDSLLLPAVTNPQVYYVFTSNSGCRSAFDSVSVAVFSVAAPVAEDTLVCQGNSVLVSATSADSVFWSTAPDISQVFHTGNSLLLPAVTTPVTYYLISRNGSCTSAWDTIHVDVTPVSTPVVQDTTVCEGTDVVLQASGPDTVFWSHVPLYGQPFHAGPTLHVPSAVPTVYHLYMQNGSCRSGIVPLSLNVYANCDELEIPNVFTPNGDGLNEYFPAPPGDYLFDFRIFGRWGQLVSSREQTATGWDGRDDNGNKVPDGTYYFVLRVIFQNNFSRDYFGPIQVLDNH